MASPSADFNSVLARSSNGPGVAGLSGIGAHGGAVALGSFASSTDSRSTDSRTCSVAWSSHATVSIVQGIRMERLNDAIFLMTELLEGAFQTPDALVESTPRARRFCRKVAGPNASCVVFCHADTRSKRVRIDAARLATCPSSPARPSLLAPPARHSLAPHDP
jgi:hypothetical protein